MSRIDETRPFHPVRIAVLAVSDTRSLAEDKSGDVLVERLTGAGHTLAARHILRDERDAIAAQLRAWVADPDIDVIITTGGTGLTGRGRDGSRRIATSKRWDRASRRVHMISVQKIGSAVQSAQPGGGGGQLLFDARQQRRCKDAMGRNPAILTGLPARPATFVWKSCPGLTNICEGSDCASTRVSR